MKKVALVLICLMASIFVNAETTVTGLWSSQHWTVAGSPYKVFSNLQIHGGDTLLIDPGVEVVFYGDYNIQVMGSFIAIGLPEKRIQFRINDTTGWYDPISVYGGWDGIEVSTYSGPSVSDTCVMEYCDISDMKGYGVLVYNDARFANCRFFHNHIAFKHTPSVMDSASMLELDACEIFGNFGRMVTVSQWGEEYIHDCKIYDNSSAYCEMYFMDTKVLFENNEVYSNHADDGAIMIFDYRATDTVDVIGRITGNSIHHNNTNSVGPLYFQQGGYFDITHNIICNNSQNIASSTCPFVQGGGALRFASGKYNISNNIIANNLAILQGGGIQINGSIANVCNNLFINNVAEYGAAIKMVESSRISFIKIKNNIFKNNIETNTGYPTDRSIVGYASGSLAITNNWIDGTYRERVDVSSPVIGDTTTNIIGTDPMLTAPTTTASFTEDATTADFTTLESSPCFNAGTLMGLISDSTDFAGNIRLRADTIDIGPYEIQVGSIGVLKSSELNSGTASLVKVWPNPTSTGSVFIETEQMGAQIYLIDISGRLLYRQVANSKLTSVNVSSFAAGTYFMVLKMPDGAQYAEKVVVR